MRCKEIFNLVAIRCTLLDKSAITLTIQKALFSLTTKTIQSDGNKTLVIRMTGY